MKALRFKSWEKMALTFVGPVSGEQFYPPTDYPKEMQEDEDDSEQEAEQKKKLRDEYQIAHRFDLDWYLILPGYTQTHTRVDKEDDQDRTLWGIWGIPGEGAEIPEGAIRYRDWEKIVLSMVDPSEDEPLLPPLDIPDDVDEDDDDEVSAYLQEHKHDEDWFVMSFGYAQSHTRLNDRDEPDDQDRTLCAVWGVPRDKASPQKDEESESNKE